MRNDLWLKWVVGVAAPEILHVLNPVKSIDRRGKVSIVLRGTKEDMVLLKVLAKGHRLSRAEIVSRLFAVFCRTLRTHRNPATGEPILWESALYGPIPTELQDYLAKANELLGNNIIHREGE